MLFFSGKKKEEEGSKRQEGIHHQNRTQIAVMKISFSRDL